MRETQGVEYAQSRLLLLLLAPRRRQASRSLENSHNWGGHSPRCQRVSFVSKCQRNGLSKVKFPFFFPWKGMGELRCHRQSITWTLTYTHTHTQRETPARGGKDTKHRKSHMYGGTTSDWAHDTRLSLSICYCLFLFVFCFLARREKKGKSLSREMEAQRLSKCPVASTTNR